MEGERFMYRIFLADDEALTLEYLQHSIPALRNTWTVCGTARNGREALEMCIRDRYSAIAFAERKRNGRIRSRK